MAERADELRDAPWPEPFPLLELWVTGDLLGPAQIVDAGAVVLVLDLPEEEVPALARPTVAGWIEAELRLGKRPDNWSFRPAAWPPWSIEHPSVVRIWSRSAGIDGSVLDALRAGRVDELPVVEPLGDEVVAQLPRELEASREHLRRVLGAYWGPGWRREHRGAGGPPEDVLWRAARAVTDLVDVVEDLADHLMSLQDSAPTSVLLGDEDW